MGSVHRRLPALPRRRIARAAAAAFVLAAALAAGGLARGDKVPTPAPAAGKAACVEDTAFMRRNHMDLLQHQSQRTVRDGVRTVKHSLANCVDCHADKETASVIGRNSAGKAGFCADCHAYVAVETNCFECHSPKRGAKLAVDAGAPR
jgi:hypothetical protein